MTIERPYHEFDATRTAPRIPYDESSLRANDGSFWPNRLRLFLSLFPSIRSYSLRCWRLAQGIRTERVSRTILAWTRLCCAHLLKSGDRFRPIDLRNVSDLGRGFDLSARWKCGALPRTGQNPSSRSVKAAPVVLSPPYTPPRRTEHVNEQCNPTGRSYSRNTATSLWIASYRHLWDRRVRMWYRQTFWYYCLPGKFLQAALRSQAPMNSIVSIG